MIYRPTILNVSTTIFLIGIIIYTIWNYSVLSHNEGWGIVAMFGLFIIRIIAVLIDLLIQKFIKNPIAANLIGLIIAIVTTFLILQK